MTSEEFDKVEEVVTYGCLEPAVVAIVVACLLFFAAWQGWLP